MTPADLPMGAWDRDLIVGRESVDKKEIEGLIVKTIVVVAAIVVIIAIAVASIHATLSSR